MNGMEMLYHILFVEWDKGLWGIIGLGVTVAILSIIYDIGCEQNNE
jgi:hypothetical protein|tara:strand:+ start:461 stop:598 length:138 start_codon:yes stop_codon:yes gene_type:complete